MRTVMSIFLGYILLSQNKSWEEHRNPGEKVGDREGEIVF